MKFRSLAAGLALLTTGTIIGITTQQLASADVTSGDRPVLVPIESCRLIDTRLDFNVGPRTAPLGPTETLTLDTQQSGTECTGQIPTTATAIAANVTAPDSTGESFITLWSSGPRPNGSTLNPQGGQLVFNAATIDLDGTNFNIYNNANNVHIIIDIIGYYDNHNHDDRYYTKAQIDEQTATSKFLVLRNPTEVNDGDYDIDLTLIVPPDYTPGTDPRVEVHIRPGLPQNCAVFLLRTYVWVSRPGTTPISGARSELINVNEPTNLTFDNVGSNQLGTSLLDFTLDVGDEIQPGDSLSFGLGELGGTTCTGGGIMGATFFYE